METDPILIVPSVAPADSILFDNEVAVRQIGQWAMVWRRFRRHRLAVIGAWVALLVVLMVIVGPLVAPPFFQPDQSGMLPWAVTRMANAAPQWHWPYLLGADGQGQPILTYVLTGGSPILIVGVGGALLASILGILIGGISGYLGSVADAFLLRIVDAFLSVPFLLFLVLVSRYLPDRSVPTYAILFGILGWAGVARLVRGYVLSLRQREFADAARALGVSPWGIVLRHLLPNALDVVVVSFTLNVAVFMVADVTLDYLGAGTGAISWGSTLGMLGSAYWWEGAFPLVPLLLVVLSVNFMGDGLRDALDTSSQTAAFTARVESGRANVLQRVAAFAASTVAAGRRAVADAVRGLELGRRARTGAERVVPQRVRVWSRAERAAAAPVPLALQVVPIGAVLLALGVVFLWGHSPLQYAPNYDAPVSFGPTYTQESYGAWPRAGGGWDLFQVSPAMRLVFERTDSDGRVVLERDVAPGDELSQPEMTENRGRILGAWIADSNQLVEVAFLGPHPSRPVSLIPSGGFVEHPDVVAMHGNRFDVLFDWQRPGQLAYDLYLAVITSPGARPHLHRLVRSRDYATTPWGVADGRGDLDVIYLQRINHDTDLWQVRFQRFDPFGPSLGRPRPLGLVSLLKTGPDGCTLPDGAPSQWAIDMKRARGGSVWGAWEYGTDCIAGGVTGANTLSVAHWSRSGRLLAGPSVVDQAVDASAGAVALALRGRGGFLYYPVPGQVEPYLQATAFDAAGHVTGVERVAYEGAGRPANSVARTVHGRPQVMWEKIHLQGDTLEGTSYHPARPPDLLTRLGLNIGNVWSNVAVVIFGSLAGGLALTIINALLLLPLVPIWIAIRRLVPGSARWLLYLAAIAGWLAWVFGAHPSPPSFVLIIGALGVPYVWLAVAGGVFVSYWSGRFILSRQDSAFRAAVMALAALYVIATMYAVIFIQSELTRI